MTSPPWLMAGAGNKHEVDWGERRGIKLGSDEKWKSSVVRKRRRRKRRRGKFLSEESVFSSRRDFTPQI